jgi:ATP-dependent helicase/DNAse subunit B
LNPDSDTLFEQTFVYKSPAGINIKGTIDAIKVLEDGSVIIYDFKSSVRKDKGLAAALYHYG